MPVASQLLEAWLDHRLGNRAIEPSVLARRSRAAVQDNAKAPQLLKSYGKKEIRTFVGFVDIVGFTAGTRGCRAPDVAAYVLPVLTDLLNVIFENDGFVDKTIGDEVMFLVPDMSDEFGELFSTSRMANILNGILDCQRRHGDKYRMRIGLSLGSAYLAEIAGKGFTEWSLFGEVVSMAKRLHGLPLLANPTPIACAFGILVHESGARDTFDAEVRWLANTRWQSTSEGLQDSHELKGISPSRCAYLLPKPDPTV